jgi:hypothetical protein
MTTANCANCKFPVGQRAGLFCPQLGTIRNPESVCGMWAPTEAGKR